MKHRKKKKKKKIYALVKMTEYEYLGGEEVYKKIYEKDWLRVNGMVFVKIPGETDHGTYKKVEIENRKEIIKYTGTHLVYFVKGMIRGELREW